MICEHETEYCTKHRHCITCPNYKIQELTTKVWCEEYKDYYGNSDPNYGGTLTDLYTLKAGTKFFVANGYWEGEKLEDDYILVHAPTGDRRVRLTERNHSLYLK